MDALQEKLSDQARIVASLAAACQVSVGEVALGAPITKFLQIFATRNVLRVLYERSLHQPPSGACQACLSRRFASAMPC